MVRLVVDKCFHAAEIGMFVIQHFAFQFPDLPLERCNLHSVVSTLDVKHFGVMTLLLIVVKQPNKHLAHYSHNEAQRKHPRDHLVQVFVDIIGLYS